MTFNTTPDLLVKLLKAGYKLVPLGDDAKTPALNSWLPIYHDPNYWTEDKLRQESYRFKNVATCFGMTIKDEQDNDTYLMDLDIDSQKVYDLLFIMEPSLTSYCQRFTFVIKTRKPHGWRISWREHKQHRAIHTTDCKVGYEFEIKTDNTSGLSTLPPSVHRDDPNFHYENTGQWKVGVCDGLYDKIMCQLAECSESDKSKHRSSSGSTSGGTILTPEDILVISGSISKYYNKPFRQSLVLAISGLLHKSGVSQESALQLIEMLAANDEEKKSRISTLEETYKKDPRSVSGKSWFLTVLVQAIKQVMKRKDSEINDVAKSIMEKLFRVIGIPKDIVAKATKTIMNEHNFLTLEESNDIWVYEGGVYVPGGDIVIEKEADAIFGYDLNSRDIQEIKGYITRKTYHKRFGLDTDLNIINMKNGLYNFKTNEFMQHTPDYLSLIQKPIIYNPNAKSKLFGKFLSEVLYPGEIRTGIEMMAYTFYNSNPFEVINILLGYGSNGKGVFTGLITSLHGSRNISNVPLKQLTDNPFALSDLENKAANIDSELSSAVILDPSMLKRITGRQPARIERKNARAYDSILHAKLFLSANKIPQTADDSYGYFRRNVMITFPNKFEGKADDPDKLEKLSTEEELSGIFNVLMIALRRIIFGATDRAKTKGIFVNGRTIQQRKEKYERATNPIKAFMREAISPESTLDDKVYKETLYQVYIRYCTELTLPFVSKENFGQVIKKDPYHIQDGRDTKEPRERFWKSIKLLNRWDIDSEQTTISLEHIASESWRPYGNNG